MAEPPNPRYREEAIERRRADLDAIERRLDCELAACHGEPCRITIYRSNEFTADEWSAVLAPRYLAAGWASAVYVDRPRYESGIVGYVEFSQTPPAPPRKPGPPGFLRRVVVAIHDLLFPPLNP